MSLFKKRCIFTIRRENMALNLEERKEALNNILVNDEPRGTRKISFAGENKDWKVFRIPINYLVLNKTNGRINTDVESWEAQFGTLDIENPEHEKKIEEWIWTKHPIENEKTISDLERNGQKEPGQVTLDGVVVGGNRRVTLLRKLGVTYFDAVIMESDSSNPLDILRLEKTLQHGVDSQVDYATLEKYFEASIVVDKLGGRKAIEDSDDLFEQVKEMLPRYSTKRELMDELDVKDSMEKYLEYIRAPGYYKALYQKENYLIEYTKSLKHYKVGNKSHADRQLTRREISDWEQMVFDLTRIQFKQDFRLLSQSDQKGENHILGREGAFTRSRDLWAEKIKPEMDELKSMDDFRKENPDNSDENWAYQEKGLGRLEDSCKEMLGIGKRELDLAKMERTPEKLLKDAARSLQKMWKVLDEGDTDLNEIDTLKELSNDCRKVSADIYNVIKRL